MLFRSPMLGNEIVADHSDPALARQAASALQELLRINPSYVPAYEMYAGLIGAMNDITTEDTRIVAEGVRRYPTVVQLAVGQAACDLKAGHLQAAQEKIDALKARGLPDGVVSYVGKIEARIQAMEGLAQAQAAYDQGAMDRAHDALVHLPRASLLPEEQLRYENLLVAMASVETLANVRAAIDRKDYEAAEVLLAGVPAENLPEKIRAEVAALSAQITAGKNTAAKN